MKIRYAFYLLLLVAILSSTQSSTLSAQPGIRSPRIAALDKELANGNRAALEPFWAEVAQRGTPLVEPVQESDKHRLVTFLWRAKEPIEWVVIASDLTDAHRELKSLRRLRDTDVWFRTFVWRNDARMTYGMVADSPAARGQAVAVEVSSLPPDPLNPRRALPGSFFPSLCELSEAPPQPWITKQPDVPAGQVEWKTLKSAKLKNEREIGVYLPPGYRADGQPYGVLFFFDGRAYTTKIPTPVILDNLLAKKLLPPLVAVFIGETKPDRRDEELSCNADFTDYVAQELVPWVRQQYRVTTAPHQTVIGGLSSGGLAASFAALRYPAVFGNVLSQSGAYLWKPRVRNPADEEEAEWLIKQYVAQEKLPVRFYLEAGLLDHIPEPSVNSVSLLISNRHLRDVLQAKGYAVQYHEFNGGHDYLNWRGTLADGLLALLGKVKQP